jgi:hypothetical protein
MLVFVGCNYERVPFKGYRDAFREVSVAQPRVQFRFADVRITNKVIMQKVREEILNCDVGLYDVTFLNPNVMMELGIAIGADKPWNILYNPTADSGSFTGKIWFNRRNTQLPANLRGYEYLEYGTGSQLRSVLRAWVQQTLNALPSSASDHWTIVANGLLAILAREPGLKINEIASRLGGEPLTFVRLILSELRKKGRVRTEGRGPGTRYFVSRKPRTPSPPGPQPSAPPAD